MYHVSRISKICDRTQVKSFAQALTMYNVQCTLYLVRLFISERGTAFFVEIVKYIFLIPNTKVSLKPFQRLAGSKGA